MHAAAVEIDLHLPACRSLKEKRAVVRPIVDGLQARFRVSVAEVGSNDLWQRARLGVAVVGASPSHLDEVLDSVERFVWTRADVEVLSTDRTWMDTDGAA